MPFLGSQRVRLREFSLFMLYALSIVNMPGQIMGLDHANINKAHCSPRMKAVIQMDNYKTISLMGGEAIAFFRYCEQHEH